jgi:hypothetical protein
MMRIRPGASALLLAAVSTGLILAQDQGRGRGANPFPGGTNPDGSLRPSAPLRGLFTQDAYTEYEILAPGSESFRIRFLPETTRVGDTEIVNATRGGSQGSDIEVYDPRTGTPITFAYEERGDSHAIRAPLPFAVPEGGIGRVLIYKTYKDPRTYMMNGDDIVWVRSLSGYRLGVVLPEGFAFLSSNVAAHMSTTASGQLKLAFANPSGQSNPVTIHARATKATFPPPSGADVFFDDVKTLYELQPAAATAGGGQAPMVTRVEQTYSDYRKGDHAMLDSLTYVTLRDLKVVDLDTGKALDPVSRGSGTAVKLGVPIVNDRQSAHLRITGVLGDGTWVRGDELTFTRTLHGLRNTVVLPAGWELASVSEAATIGRTSDGRAFAAFINLNAGNQYRVTVLGRR